MGILHFIMPLPITSSINIHIPHSITPLSFKRRNDVLVKEKETQRSEQQVSLIHFYNFISFYTHLSFTLFSYYHYSYSYHQNYSYHQDQVGVQGRRGWGVEREKEFDFEFDLCSLLFVSNVCVYLTVTLLEHVKCLELRRQGKKRFICLTDK